MLQPFKHSLLFNELHRWRWIDGKLRGGKRRKTYMPVYSERRWQHFVLAVFLSLCFAGPVLAQVSSIPDSMSQTGLGGANSIIGTVFGPSGRPVESRIRVRLSTMTSGDRIQTTNENGNFAFRGLPTGSYTVLIEKEKEFEPTSHSVDIRQFRGAPPQVYTLNIRLAFKAGTEVKPGVLNAELVNVPQRALVHYNNALEQAKNNDHRGAIDQLKLAIKEYPSFPLAFNELGVQYLKLNQLENADEAFQGALKIAPDAFAVLINRGIANVMMKRYGEAVPILRKALKKNDKSAVGHYFLGQALANLGLFEQAEKELLASLELGKEEMKEAHRILAIIYTSRGDKKQAAAELEAYLKLAPDARDAEKLKDMIRQLKESNE
jgi:Flp pilus assembly protein TadD